MNIVIILLALLLSPIVVFVFSQIQMLAWLHTIKQLTRRSVCEKIEKADSENR